MAIYQGSNRLRYFRESGSIQWWNRTLYLSGPPKNWNGNYAIAWIKQGNNYAAPTGYDRLLVEMPHCPTRANNYEDVAALGYIPQADMPAEADVSNEGAVNQVRTTVRYYYDNQAAPVGLGVRFGYWKYGQTDLENFHEFDEVTFGQVTDTVLTRQVTAYTYSDWVNPDALDDPYPWKDFNYSQVDGDYLVTEIPLGWAYMNESDSYFGMQLHVQIGTPKPISPESTEQQCEVKVSFKYPKNNYGTPNFTEFVGFYMSDFTTTLALQAAANATQQADNALAAAESAQQSAQAAQDSLDELKEVIAAERAAYVSR